MSTLTLPLNFGERPCDRSLIAYLRQPGSTDHGPRTIDHGQQTADNGQRTTDPSSYLWAAFLVWKDFGIARDDRRTVPLNSADRRVSHPVSIIEQYCGWDGAAGSFVEAAILAGFFLLSPVDEATAELVLVDFFPANHSGARDISNSKLGGISKGVNIARKQSLAAADEQLDFYAKTKNPMLETIGKTELREAVMFVHQVCKILKRNPPASKEWAEALTVKALQVLDHHSSGDIDLAFKWLLSNRSSQEIPLRLDFLLDRFPDFVAKGNKDFR